MVKGRQRLHVCARALYVHTLLERCTCACVSISGRHRPRNLASWMGEAWEWWGGVTHSSDSMPVVYNILILDQTGQAGFHPVTKLQWPYRFLTTGGNTYNVDSRAQCISVFSSTYQFLKCFGKGSTSLGAFPLSIRIGGSYMYISDPYKGVLFYFIILQWNARIHDIA